ncbi:Tol-Pal system beta propeller repeat protein TolB [Bisgaard Taxon 10/6]|uniref:Tol-Pal system protein TolB n=1 Tax=Exercitatus varius TaxID=67857 RepID=A0AAW6QAR3_9PAST|nr:Tol-Pal system beta propeller repeat protein TolB [Exercitatus varius]MDG2917198.1 Tol-Pal system beta propeller repeat protein TolB [Exercitatus varius]MDG2939292.1 Tol-Pal system beta propeller repeat protein TolB [Exercitatus varius]MDG2942628.1 Tol-Pal system beta propeller repeat protein TolB [Exercitatus varius]MDG2945142.1 Tol-Pal system beta propeller repeat protein TolB [Exercitatus varius]MDG2948451.1 Tol-Pal system beta propeller repeat protein TolB [Exercitatus varius]
MKLIARLMSMCAVLFFVINSAYADDEVRIVIDEGVEGARPIAVVPFKSNGSVPADVAEIVTADLRNSGKFNPIPVNQMPQQPGSASEVTPDAWASLGIDAVVVGQVTASGNGYQIAYQLVDTVGASGNAGAVLAQNSLTVQPKWIRWGAHQVSDEVFEKMTGIKGAFRTRIAYVVQRNSGSHELRIADYDGFNQFVVARSSQPIMSPAWSPDGQRLAYVSFENKKSQLVVHNLGSGQRKVVAAFPGHNGAPAFSPDGSRLAFANNQDGKLNIYVMNSNGGQPTKLTSGAGNNTEPSWTPDGRILFTSDRSGSPQVYSMSSSGGGATLIGGGRSYSGQMSSDGKSLVMISGDNVVKYDTATGASEVLSSTFLDESPSLSPNGIMIIYSSTQGLGKVLQLVSADGRFKARLPGSDGQVKFPAWSPYLTK